ncbi:hypothetical protein AAL_05239 [Moelleriella libera RCEF 2490]|uniref:Uncharacterized protein n=1 Tax=Moelleriella libera RCEF 2490 TaxID=1081109 RepID=A0A162IHG8_9HYPO|nr:hypothetical protein AAL_05239 [Moelleriella libera RCEF 2490]
MFAQRLLTRPLRVGALALRPYHTTPPTRRPYKDSQDRESLKPEANEYTRSGRDTDVTKDDPHAAFGQDGAKSPEAAKGDDPLQASPANQELSKPQDSKESGGEHTSGAGKEIRKGGRSGGGAAPKKGHAGKTH